MDFPQQSQEKNHPKAKKVVENMSTGECYDTPHAIDFDRTSSNIFVAKDYGTNRYSLAYLYNFPGTQCDLYVSYAHPYYNETGFYEGGAGFGLNTDTLRGYLEEKTGEQSTSFIVDLNTEYLIATSSGEDVLDIYLWHKV